MDTENRSFSALVKEMRRQLSLSQEDLARGLGERGKYLMQEFFPGEES
jgi:DNA-binding XRE family transcriptional regulator